MADQLPAVADRLDVVDVVMVRESKRRRQHLRGHGGGKNLVSVPDGQHRGGRSDVRAALKPWQFVVQDEDSDGQT